MGDDDLTHRVGIDKADEENKWDEVEVKNDRLQIEVRCDQAPGGKAWNQSKKRILLVLGVRSRGFHGRNDVHGA